MKRSVSPLVLFVIGAVATLGLALYAGLSEAPEEQKAFVAAVASFGIVAVAAVVVIAVAVSFGPREPWGRQWFLLGLGVSACAAGHLLHSVRAAAPESIIAAVPPDAFFIAEYVLLAAGLVAVAQAYLPMVDWRLPAIVSALLGVGAIALLWFGVVTPFVLPVVETASEAVRTVLYPTADVMFLLVPAAFVSLALGQMAGSRFARPWLAVAAAATVLALSDAAIVWMQVTGRYWAGSVVDYGPLAAQGLVALGALFAARLAEEFMRPAAVEA